MSFCIPASVGVCISVFVWMFLCVCAFDCDNLNFVCVSVCACASVCVFACVFFCVHVFLLVPV